MAITRKDYQQEPIAIIGIACRLPGGSNSPQQLWDFLERGGIASNKVPENRFNIKAHHDGSHKPGTMRPSGGMFLEDIDLADFDASFFEISRQEAISMDPNQRQMLEVVYEGLENAGVSLKELKGAPVGCFVGSYASDYMDMQNRDPLDRPENIVVGGGRAILANRISHFLDIKGPSMTIDTACSGSLVGVDLAARYLGTREINSAIIAASNLYLSPEHVMDRGGVGAAHSPTGLCHTFDISADGYVKAEAVSMVMLKRLDDAIRDGDPIRAVIRGSATNSDGRTPGIANPSSEAQANAIRAAYAHAGITDLNDTGYLECHGTGTQAGDPAEVNGVSSVFAATRSADNPLIIGSIKSNIGHAEPGAGISGVLKAIFAMEKGIIPGNPTFVNPNPKIDFAGWKVKASRTAIPWPSSTPLRRVSVNSFGYGGSNSHVVLEEPKIATGPSHKSSYINEDDDFLYDEEETIRPSTLVLSANDEQSLRANVKAISNHLINPRTKVSLTDLAYTLSERRTHHFHRAYVVARNLELQENAFVLGKINSEKPRVGFIFTGQGAQWPQMGKDLLEVFPSTRVLLQELDQVLQSLPNAPAWSLLSEISEPRTAEHVRQPEFSQPLVTALQLCILSILEEWGVKPQSVAGHSSGEIAAAHAAGLLSKADAIKAAFYRGRAARNIRKNSEVTEGMLAVGLGAGSLAPYLENYQDTAWIACFNSSSSLTVSGKLSALESLKRDLQTDNHFARSLQVDLAYHSQLMDDIGTEYERLLDQSFNPLEGSGNVSMFSSVTGNRKNGAADARYWKTNMVSPVRFDDAVKEMLSGQDAANFLIEIGPSGALAGPITQIKKSLPNQGNEVSYCASWSRGADAVKSVFDTAGRLFIAGGSVALAKVNQYEQSETKPVVIIDLPNYVWNHSTKYWHENDVSKDWRFKNFVHHDLLGSKVMGTSWNAPSFRRLLRLDDVPWLRDHKVGTDIVLPGAGFITMAVEAMYQKKQSTEPNQNVHSANDLCYRFRNVRFDKALVVEEEKQANVMLSLKQEPGSNDWHEFRITSSTDDVFMEHCGGLVRTDEPIEEVAAASMLDPLKHPTSGWLWYKAHTEAGYGFGPAFQKILKVESKSGDRRCRTLLSLANPPSKWEPQSSYPIHPASLDGCIQTVTASLWAGERSSMNAVLVPAIIDDLVINKVRSGLEDAVSSAVTEYSGRGRLENATSYYSNTSVFDSKSGEFLMHIHGMRYAKLDAGNTKSDETHVFERVSWKPDISFLTQDQLAYLPAEDSASKIDLVVNLIAHKKPALKVLEVNLEPEDLSNIWFEAGDASSRAAYVEYSFASSDAKSLISMQSKHESQRNSSFQLLNTSKDGLGLLDEVYDLAIVKARSSLGMDPSAVIKNLKSLLSEESYVVFIGLRSSAASSEAGSNDSMIDDSGLLSETPNGRASLDSSNTEYTEPEDVYEEKINDFNTLENDGTQVLEETVASEPSLGSSASLEQHMVAHKFGSVMTVSDACVLATGVTTPGTIDEKVDSLRTLCVARLARQTPTITSTLKNTLERSSWKITEHVYPFDNIGPQSTILILDELSTPLLTEINSKQWESLRKLISTGNNLLWVTKGSQHEVTEPNNALVHGLFRTIRMEDPNAKLTTLDVQSSTSTTTAFSIDLVLRSLRKSPSKQFGEFEFAERNGILHVHRLLPDVPINKFRADEREGPEPTVRYLHAAEATVMLRAERKGTLNSLQFCETTTSEVAVESNRIEVEIVAAGANFKDVAVTMGIVPENEFALGLEASGIVKRLGPGVERFKVGDRVCFLNNGSYANRVQVSAERTHAIPDSMSFEDAATIPLVYLTSIYSLFNVANLRKHQSVLIHSAAGGLGIACVQLARYIGAEIYVTVSTEEKRMFLAENYGIPYDRMFSSRNTKFVKEILAATNGRGIDVIINSLTGELLDESWRITADGGTMVELGKKDIIDRNRLSMEPFDRNCSFRAVDFSYIKVVSNELIASLLSRTFELINDGHIKPIHPVSTYGFDDIPSALAYIRSGKHIGKIVITNGERSDVQVPIRPAIKELCLLSNASYLIVGGLKGLCGNLAIHMAIHGAKRIIVVSRSGLQDDLSRKVTMNCAAWGCEIIEAKGDVTNLKFLRQVFENASPAIAGVIQGAMILRDKPYELMTLDEYHTSIFGKVQGTWNLHTVSLEQKQPLDFFTMLSSISGIIGKKGQSNYAAANTFLDAFATYRRSFSLCAHAVDLGLIEDVGYIAEQGGMDGHFDKKQWIPILEGTLRKILTYSIMQQIAPISKASATQMVTGIAFPLPNHSDLIRDARFGYQFAQNASSGAVKEGNEGDQTVRALLLMHKSGADRSAMVKTAVEVMSALFTRILRLDSIMEPAKPPMAYGVDSLAAVELRNWVRMELGAELTTLDITNASSLIALCEKLIVKLPEPEAVS